MPRYRTVELVPGKVHAMASEGATAQEIALSHGYASAAPFLDAATRDPEIGIAWHQGRAQYMARIRRRLDHVAHQDNERTGVAGAPGVLVHLAKHALDQPDRVEHSIGGGSRGLSTEAREAIKRDFLGLPPEGPED